MLKSIERLGKQLFWFFQRWLSCRQKPNVLFVRLAFHNEAQRSSYDAF
jgi:hypothetical protein